MIEHLVQSGRLIADHLMLLDALNSRYEILVASDGSDITEDPSVLPSAMIWIYDCDRATVVIAVQRQEADDKYVAAILIRPYTRDVVGRQILCDPLPEDHPSCRRAVKEAAVALAVQVVKRRMCGASDRPEEVHTVDYSVASTPRDDLDQFQEISESVAETCRLLLRRRRNHEAEVHRGSATAGLVAHTTDNSDPDDDQP